LPNGRWISIDRSRAAHQVNLSADQGRAHCELRDGECLRDGIRIPIDSTRTIK
jgi:hypothetical protein